jgi:DNA-binding transcriptional ArsR family regulator
MKHDAMVCFCQYRLRWPWVAAKTKRAKTAIDAASLGKAISHPLRLRIWTILTERSASAIGMSEELGCASPDASYHIKVLRELGFVEEVGHKPRRGATERFYRAVTRPMVDSDGLAALPSAVAAGFIGQAMQRVLDDFVGAGEAGLIEGQEVEMCRLPMLLDDQGREEAQREFDERLEKLQDIQARSDGRRAESGDDGRHYTAAQMCFEVPKDTAS